MKKVEKCKKQTILFVNKIIDILMFSMIGNMRASGKAEKKKNLWRISHFAAQIFAFNVLCKGMFSKFIKWHNGNDLILFHWDISYDFPF